MLFGVVGLGRCQGRRRDYCWSQLQFASKSQENPAIFNSEVSCPHHIGTFLFFQQNYAILISCFYCQSSVSRSWNDKFRN